MNVLTLPLRMSVITIALVLSSSLHANTQEASVESLIENIETHFPDFLGDAENYMEQALELAPDNPKVNYYCGMIYGLRASEGFMAEEHGQANDRALHDLLAAL